MQQGSGAGLGDPYWFEWSIGQEYVVDMLDPASGIRSVTLQASGEKGLDDVVVRFHGNRRRFIQVKHTRVEDSLTFGDLVSGSPSLLSHIAAAWNSEVSKTSDKCEAWLVSNRALGTVYATAGSDVKVVRPPLAAFLEWLTEETSRVASLSDVVVPAQWQNAWDAEWMVQLSVLGDDDSRLRFLREFRVQGSEVGLAEIESRIEHKLASMFDVNDETAHRFGALLDKALRSWATSHRGAAEAITREAAFARLCLVEDDQVGDHDLSPPAPFFETRLPIATEIESALAARTTAVAFVTGEPGSGKTSLISSLANKREPVIDARFYAYRPITPANQLLPVDAGRTTTARALWSDLLLQLRAVARGSLLELGLPLHAASLSVNALRSHVLRVANTLGERRARPFVIAIDGIDHAARAGAGSDTLLASLVPPDQVPPHVAFLIGGQPPDAYPSYPVWLRMPAAGVQRIDLPRLTLEDTHGLLEARLPRASTLELENASRDIWHVCRGHTLSTVFAVAESVLYGDLATIGSHLSARHLASGVDAYYERIWASATASIATPGVSTRIAACLCLMPVRITPSLLTAVLGEPAGTATVLNDTLRRLRPLVVEENTGFRVFHNDVRVFLLRLLQADSSVYRDCASRIADYLLRVDELEARHAVVHDLLTVAERWSDVAALFTPQYVLEGHAIGRSLGELTDQGLQSAEAITRLSEAWSIAHALATGLQTLEQLRSSLEWRSAPHESRRSSDGGIPTSMVERRVAAPADWTREIVQTALADISELQALGERDRATAAFGRWFAGLSPATVEELIQARDRNDDPQAHEQVSSLLESLGRLSVSLQVPLPVSSVKLGSDGDEDNTDEAARSAEAVFSRGVLNAAGNCIERVLFRNAIHRLRIFYLQDAQKLIARLIDSRDWFRCGYLLQTLRVPEHEDWQFNLQAAVAAALVGKASLQKKWIAPLIAERPKALRGSVSIGVATQGEIQQITAMAMSAFVFGHEAPNCEPSLIREEIEAAYRKTSRDERRDGLVSLTLHAAAMLGSYVATTIDRKQRALHIVPANVARSIKALFSGIRESPNHIPFGYHDVAATIVRGFVDCAQQDPQVRAAVYPTLREHLASQASIDVFVDSIWRVLADGGNRQELLTFAEAWVGNDGKAWREPPADRHSIVERLTGLMDEIGEHESATTARSRLPWADIGYSGHKDYSLHAPLKWFELLAERDPTIWKPYGIRLLAVSLEASRTGDNRMSFSIEDRVLTAACIVGPSAVARIADAPNSSIGPGHRAILSGLLGMARHAPLSTNDIQAIWGFSIGQLCWQVSTDRRRLAEVRLVLSDALSRVGGQGQLLWMSTSAPAEFACVPDERDEAAINPESSTHVPPQAIGDEMTNACSARDWKEIAVALERIVMENPPQAAALVTQAWTALALRPERNWWYDGAGSAYELIYPLLTPVQRWQGVLRAVEARAYEVPAYLTSTLAENLDNFCRLAASNDDGALRTGLTRLLEMHELWISGGGHLPSCPQVLLAPLNEDQAGWSSFFAGHLLELAAFDEMEYVAASLRGIRILLSIQPSISESVVAALRAAPSHVVRRFLLSAEVIAALPGTDAIRAWMREQLDSNQLDIGLSAWTALRTAHHSLGLAEPEWPRRAKATRLITPVARPLLHRPESRRGLLTTTARASENVLKYLEEAVGDTVDDIRSEFYNSIRQDPPIVRSARLRPYVPGDMVFDRSGDAELSRLFGLLAVHERQGRFADTPISRLAEALVSFADPFVFLTTPRPIASTEGWPTDDSLDGQAAQSSVLLTEAIVDCLGADLRHSERLIGATFRTYSRDLDVRVTVDHVVARMLHTGSERRPSVLNARSSLAFESPAMWIAKTGAHDQVWLTARIGGLFYFTHATVELFPSPIWLDVLAWKPAANNPLVWQRDGRNVAWYEQVHGPIRDIYPGDFVYRQPAAGRWICLATEWDRLTDLLGQPARRVEMDIARNRDP